MNILYPTKSLTDVDCVIKKYEYALKESKKGPKILSISWEMLSFLWTLFDIFTVLIALRYIYFILTNAGHIYVRFLQYEGGFSDALVMVILTGSSILLVSKGIRKLLKRLLFPKSRKAPVYVNALGKLFSLHEKYEDVEYLKKCNPSNISFQVKRELNSRKDAYEDKLYMSAVDDGLKKDFCFDNGMYEVSSQDGSNTVNLRFMDKVLGEVIAEAEMSDYVDLLMK